MIYVEKHYKNTQNTLVATMVEGMVGIPVTHLDNLGYLS